MAMLREQILGDWAYFDGVEDVTHTSRRTGAETEEVKGLQRPVEYAQTTPGSDVAPEPVAAKWHLWVDTLGGAVVEPDDLITTESGETWVITSCRLVTLKTRWECQCLKFVE